ncbi:MAG: hypothetical protein H7831_18360 [Magnetococcus sp. WYHC-3]
MAPHSTRTENIYKIYAESFRGTDHLHRILREAQMMVNAALAPVLDDAGAKSEK